MQRPTAQRGHTTFIANDRGHLLPGVAQVRADQPSAFLLIKNVTTNPLPLMCVCDATEWQRMARL